LVGACADLWNRNHRCIVRSGKARYIPHDDAAHIPPLQVAINAFSGIPSLGELGLLKWRPGGGNIWFLPGTPMQDIIEFIRANARQRGGVPTGP